MQLLGSKKSESLSRWFAQCCKCKGEAFGYFGFKNPKVEWIGAKIYYRGLPPTSLTEDAVDKEKVRCGNCREILKEESQIKVAREPFTVKSMMRLIETMEMCLQAYGAINDVWPRMVEYAYIIGLPLEDWEKMRVAHEKNFKNLSGVAGRLFESCVGFGNCSDEPAKPSEIVVARGIPDIYKKA